MTYVFALLLLSSCGQITNKKQGMTDKVRPPTNDTSNYAILQFDKTNNWIFKNSVPTTLTESEIQRIDALLKQSIDSYNSKQQSLLDSISKINSNHYIKVENIIIDISKYKSQYFPVMNQKNEKEVWVNCFCNDLDLNWKKEIVVGVDGGICFFNVIINLSTGKFYRLLVNGDA
jgi:hypothetical protein